MKDRATILSSYLNTRLRRFSSRAQLHAWQDRQVRRLLKQVLKRSSFYAQQFEGLRLQDWPHAPLLDKDKLMAHFDTLNTAGIRKADALAVALKAEATRDFSPTIKGITVGLSSGTSGNRGLFLVSKVERLRWAGAVLAKVLPGPLWNAHRVAFFLRANSNLYGTVTSHRLRFAYFDLLDPPATHLERLGRFQPTLLVAPPSMLRLLAEAMKQGLVRLAPQKVVSVAEVLDPLDEVLIAEVFDQPVHQVYQCTEGFLGCTCAHGTLHLNEDLVVVQKDYLDEKLGKFAPIVTDFNRITQPILRYRLNDILSERTTACRCGSILTPLDQIEGRCDDLFYLPRRAGPGWVHVFPDFVRRAIISASEGVEAYRVRQLDPQTLEVALQGQPLSDLQADVSDRLDALWRRLDCAAPALRFETLTEAEPTRKKHKRVERCFEIKHPTNDLLKP